MSGRMTKEEYETLGAFRYALRQFLHFSEQAARRVGLEPRQYQALLAVKSFPGRERITIGDLAERLKIRHHSAVGLVNRLEAQKLVAREPAQEDRRQVFVILTERGSELLEQLASVHRDELRRLGPQMRELLGELASSPAERVAAGGEQRRRRAGVDGRAAGDAEQPG